MALQEKLQLLNEKFAKHRCYLGAGSSIKTSTLEPITEHSSEGTLVGNAAEEGPLVDIKSDEQLMAEMALLEAKLLDLKGKLDEAEDKNSNLDEELSKERNKRRELESHFLGSLNHRYNGGNGHRGSLLSAGDFERSGLLRLVILIYCVKGCVVDLANVPHTLAGRMARLVGAPTPTPPAAAAPSSPPPRFAPSQLGGQLGVVDVERREQREGAT